MGFSMIDLNKTFGHLSDEAYLDAVNAIVDAGAADENFPAFPSESIQAQFVGSAFRNALAEAFVFYAHVKAIMLADGRKLTPDKQYLDFGCGWGRFIRFFGREVRPENILGVDIDPDILAVCRDTRVPGRLERIEPLGRIPAPDGSIDLTTAYSVFTHLPEQVHLHWKRELARVTAPGGTVALTLEPRRFLDFIETMAGSSQSPWHQAIAQYAPQAQGLRERFDAGDLVYLPTGGGAFRPTETYGEAVVSLEYVRTHWSDAFDIVEYLDDPSQFWQAVLILRRKR
jgi:ubiquinone/menaquinone biosynthesis C-methylase UbiE